MEEHLAWGFPKDKLQQHVFAREPVSAGETTLWCVDTTLDNSCRSGILVTLRALIVWSPTEIRRYELSRMERVRLTETLKGQRIDFLYESHDCAAELPPGYQFDDYLFRKSGAKGEASPEASNVCSCRIPDQTHPLLKLLLLFFAAGSRVLNARVTSEDQASRLVYKKAWLTVDDEFLFFTRNQHPTADERPEHEPLRNIQGVTTRALPAGAQARIAFSRGLWPSLGMGFVILVGTLIGLRGDEIPGDRLVLGAVGAILGGGVLGLLFMVLPDAVSARPLTLHLLKTSSGGVLAIAADEKQKPQLGKLLQELEAKTKNATP